MAKKVDEKKDPVLENIQEQELNDELDTRHIPALLMRYPFIVLGFWITELVHGRNPFRPGGA